MEIAKLELPVPNSFRHAMSLISFTEFVEKYLDDELIWVNRVPSKAALCGYRDIVCAPGKTDGTDKAAKKQARNIYDARMRDTNLYVRYLESKVLDGKPRMVDSSTQTKISNVHSSKILKC